MDHRHNAKQTAARYVASSVPAGVIVTMADIAKTMRERLSAMAVGAGPGCAGDTPEEDCTAFRMVVVRSPAEACFRVAGS